MEFVDTDNCEGFRENFNKNVERYACYNEGEARLIVGHVERLVARKINERYIKVISPYAQQVRLIRRKLERLYPDVEVGTVDSFQGREGEAVLISMVRSNKDKNVGFLKDKRRLNVTLTRAKRQLFIVGDYGTLSSDPNLKRCCDYIAMVGKWTPANSLPEGESFLKGIFYYFVKNLKTINCLKIKFIVHEFSLSPGRSTKNPFSKY